MKRVRPKRHSLYDKWTNIKQRCYNPNVKNYHRYGGRGIIICDEWKDNYKAFHDWSIQNGYEEGLEIDRIDNNGNYEPSNCRYITCAENIRNSTTVKLNIEKVEQIRLIYKEGKTMKELSEIYDVSESNVSMILLGKSWIKKYKPNN